MSDSTTRHRFRLTRRRSLALLALSAALPPARAQTASAADPEANTRWQQVRRSLYGTREIRSGDGIIVLEVPPRAEDAAVVPIAVRAQFAQQPDRHIRQVTVVIDNNPSPIAAILRYTLDSGRADIETRVRIDEYTFVRAVAETGDGQLYMASRYVKASGGCSAPPGKDPASAQASLGRMRLRAQGDPAGTAPLPVQLMISHPNDSGLVMDQLTRQYAPAHFVRKVDVTYAGRLVLSADLDFAISENPNLRFHIAPRAGGGELRAQVVDTRDLKFEQAITLGMAP
ncbi:quinoprotein dehydrogenase-associated SoxYZ-like carrier [Piscinibacter sp. XHJ-5]|uniref:quinoprotein dehydrogenase-associated SoxYZ-like carrier n=1 Tax=Piscinibacter sp. XHJ-5 TaxID=3037797 RepID=UPI002452DDD1|nr:quinoprotein dehydrogenase-associated SoxYZ-like carrier [Piscinibacter sp. XHJ-5]